MKMTWKNSVNDSKNKTRKRPISLNPNLPFEDVNSSSDANSAAEPLNEGTFLGNDGLSDKKTTISDEEAGERRNLAGEFEAQGNKLAEMCNLLMQMYENSNGLCMDYSRKSPVKKNEEPADYAIESFDKALALKPDSLEARDDRKTASPLVKKRKQLHSIGLSSEKCRFLVGDEG
ncbi:hypothetical protein C2S51_007914 [Perilla frutescens var. frutescens]|nr:hypothetical protein C2S51_007914 [Perilla frutescens var. frutescens]